MASLGAGIVTTLAVLCGLPLGAGAADLFEYRVLFDTDDSAATGCAVPVADAALATTVAGVDHVVVVRVERSSQQAAQVTEVVRRVCGAGALGPDLPVHPGDWPVGLDNGIDGADVVEGLVSRQVLGDSSTARVAFAATRTGGNSDVLLTRDGSAGSAPLRFALLQASPAPAMSTWSITVALLLMAGAAYVALRRYPRSLRLGVIAAIAVIGRMVVAQVATITTDGAVGDWGAIAPLGRDALHDSSAGDDAEDIVAAFMAQTTDTVYVRFDLLNVIDPAPTRTHTAMPVAATPTSTTTAAVPAATPTRTATAGVPAATSTATAVPETPTATPPHTATASPTATPVDCAHPDTMEGTPCNDGSKCTTTDTCLSGVCVGSGAVVCNFPPPCRDAGSCDPATGACVYPPTTNGTPCNDGTTCSVGDTCQDGQCRGTPIICPLTLPTQCTFGIADCNPATSQCVPRAVPNGTPCDDGNACTSSDSCQGGGCTGSPCGEGTACCSQELGCVDIRTSNAHCGGCDRPCVDSVCLGGQCYAGCVIDGVGYPNGARNPANQCQACDTSMSRTAWSILGLPAQPNPSCALGCGSGLCFSGNCMPVSQSGGCSGTECRTGVCQNNGCVFTPQNEGAACVPEIASNPCANSTGTCQSGQCVPNPSNEGGYCQVKQPVTGWDAECRSKVNGTCASGACIPDTLPDGTVCHGTTGSLCTSGSCVNGQCPDPLPQSTTCTNLPPACGGGASSCNPSTGQCVYPTPQVPYPSHGTISCNGAPFAPDPSKCCPGQVCICKPHPSAGIPSFCFDHECWTPEDVPDFQLP